jgi:hypothetical protein
MIFYDTFVLFLMLSSGLAFGEEPCIAKNVNAAVKSEHNLSLMGRFY